MMSLCAGDSLFQDFLFMTMNIGEDPNGMPDAKKRVTSLILNECSTVGDTRTPSTVPRARAL